MRTLFRVNLLAARVLFCVFLCAFSLVRGLAASAQVADAANSFRPSIQLAKVSQAGGGEVRTADALPAVGEDARALYAEAARADAAVGAFAPTPSRRSEWWWLVLGFLLLLPVVALSRAGETFVSAVETFLSKTFAGGEKLFHLALRTCGDWLSKTGARPSGERADDARTDDDPLFMLLGLVCLVFTSLAAYGDYFILNQSLIIFWPSGDTTWVMAATMAGVKALVGTCLHLFRGKRFAKVLLGGLLFLLLVSEFTVSYMRVVEIEAVTKVERTAALHGDDGGSLIINDPTIAAGKQPRAASAPGPAEEKNYFSFYALLSGLFTVIFALGETVGLYAATRYAGTALVWIVASPALGVLAAAYCAFRFLNQSGIVGLVKAILTALIDILSWLASVAALARSLPPRLACGYRAWRVRRLQHSEELKRLRKRLELETASELELLGIELSAKQDEAGRHRAYAASEAEARWRRRASMSEKLRLSAEEIFEDVLGEARRSWRRVNEQLSEDAVQVAAARMRQTADPVAEQLSSAAAGVFEKVGGMLSSVSRYRRLSRPDESTGKAAVEKLEG